MPRLKKSSITNSINHDDERLLRGLHNVRCMTNTLIKENLNLTQDRINQWKDEGFLQSKVYFNKITEKPEDLYFLSKSGKLLTERHLGLKTPYVSTSDRHDIRLAKAYLKLDEKKQESWKTETAWKKELKSTRSHLASTDKHAYNKLEGHIESFGMSAIDGAYLSADGSHYVAMEIIGDGYSKELISAKISFMVQFDIHY